MHPAPTSRPPVIFLGGGANALSVARSLGARGVTIYAINEPSSAVRHSRFVKWIPLVVETSVEQAWERFLLGPESEPLRGAVLLTGSDAGLAFLANRRERLRERFLLDESNPQAQLRMLSKLETYESAVAAGVPTPRFWRARSPSDLEVLRDHLVFPLIVKPLLSHLFEQRFGAKFFRASGYEELLAAFRQVHQAGIEVLLVEVIPGPDDLLCSYYTYLDAEGRPLFDFTKRVIRRFPAGMGGGCLHITDRVPDVKELSLALFRHVGLRGLANAEFKLDMRDGELKLIECNARYTAANCLVAASGYDLAWFVYCRLTGTTRPKFVRRRSALRLWYPVEDFHAFRELSARGELSVWRWLWSLAHPFLLPYFRWDDPLPTLMAGLRRLGRLVPKYGRTPSAARKAPRPAPSTLMAQAVGWDKRQ